jgi:hypothetical protein
VRLPESDSTEEPDADRPSARLHGPTPEFT